MCEIANIKEFPIENLQKLYIIVALKQADYIAGKIAIYKTISDLNPQYMKEIFTLNTRVGPRDIK